MKRERGAFDFETYEWVHPYCYALRWGAPGERETLYHAPVKNESPGQVAAQCLIDMHTIARSGGPSEWWAHNGGKFDTLFLLAAADRMAWSVSANVTGNGRIVTATFRPPDSKQTLHMRDSYAVVQSSLEKAVKSFQCDVAKTFTPDDYSKDVRTWDKERLREGCIQDCECVLQLLDKVETLAEQWGGGLRSTFSSVALSIMKSEVELPSHEGNESVNAWCRGAYLGGRVEIFRHTPDKEMSVYDCNSSYPASLAEDLPWEFLYVEEREISLRNLVRFHSENAAIVDATVSVRQNSLLPVLPYRPSTGGVYFPVGQWRGRFALSELQYAIQTGDTEVKALHSAAVYSKSDKLAPFVRRVYETKQHASGAVREFTKLVLNGGYGKFGQKPEREQVQLYETEMEAYAASFDMKTKPIDPNNRRLLTVFQHRWPKQTHYALAAYITAGARMRLHEALSKSDGIAYCDTDSVHSARFPEALSGVTLGAWKCEVPSMRGEYFAPKIYRLTMPDGKVKLAAKGFHFSKVDAEQKFAAVIKGMPIEQMTIRGARGQLRKGNTPERIAVIKRWRGLSSKRRRLPGPEGRTVPWNVNELEKGQHLLNEGHE